MEIKLDLTEPEFDRLKALFENVADKAYLAEDLDEGKFCERLLEQLERERWKPE